MGTKTILRSLITILCLIIGAVQMTGCKSRPKASFSNAESWESISNRWSSVPFKKLERKAERGDVTAQYFMSVAYDRGLGVESNRAEAFKWTKLAAEQGMPGAETRLGWMLQYGRGVTTNLVEAGRGYRLGAEDRDAMAQNNLGWV